MAQPRRRLDAELVRRGLVTSREQAQTAVDAGRVLVGGAVALKAARLVAAGEALELVGPGPRFVSRGGEKLDAALDRFGIDSSGLDVLDAGASTGGFTDCLLQRGAVRVVAVDVGHGQLHERLRADPRVEVHERVNVRDPDVLDLVGGRPFPLVVADVSFISLTVLASNLVRMTGPGGQIVVLVKPQFEAGRVEVSKGRGVVRDPIVWGRVVTEVRTAFERAGAAMMGLVRSPITGADGNVEFLMHLRVGLGPLARPAAVHGAAAHAAHPVVRPVFRPAEVVPPASEAAAPAIAATGAIGTTPRTEDPR